MSLPLRTKWLLVRVQLQSLKIQISRLLWARSSLIFRKTIECGYTLKLVRDMIIMYSQMNRTDKYSQHSSIPWPVWLNGWVFVYELSGCGFEFNCCHSIIFSFNGLFKSISCILQNVKLFNSLLLIELICSQCTLSLHPEKIRKPDGFLMFSWVREKVHW